MLHVIYRACDSDKINVRPKFYSKKLCLKSLINSLKGVRSFDFTLFYDVDKTPDDFKKAVAEINGKIVNLSKIGNSQSCWRAYERSLKFPQKDWVYFSEDDYLYTPEAMPKLVNCIKDVKEADYITLFDHPVRYADDYHYGLDLPHKINTIFISRDHHWRTQESTCMTFASQVRTLKEDKKIFEKYVKQTEVPEDRELFKRLQGLAGYEKRSAGRLLIGPMPSLITHCHEPWMAPIVDWKEVAKLTERRYGK